MTLQSLVDHVCRACVSAPGSATLGCPGGCAFWKAAGCCVSRCAVGALGVALKVVTADADRGTYASGGDRL
jgi:hypothetical protein